MLFGQTATCCFRYWRAYLALVAVLGRVVAEEPHLHLQQIVLVWGFAQAEHL